VADQVTPAQAVGGQALFLAAKYSHHDGISSADRVIQSKALAKRLAAGSLRLTPPYCGHAEQVPKRYSRTVNAARLSLTPLPAAAQ
jgi:hypothetical protein